MSRYLDKRKTVNTISFVKRISIFKSLKSDEIVPEVKPNQVHVEYKEPSFFRRLLSWRRKMRLRELEEELSEAEKMDVEELEDEIEGLEEEENQLDEMSEEVEMQRYGLLRRLFQKLGFSRAKYLEELEEEGFDEEEAMLSREMDEDVKEVLKITHSWIEKLSEGHKREFKSSQDFEKYKTILLKYGLIRETPKREPVRNISVTHEELVTTGK
ncbi:MAG: hypothetical protein ABIC91_06475 [Nanoarchaeota archaeon]|nr:hypothetical protein [Nanoarchaeota archaeon]MBU1030707.1 hypothetical protein [Nanoarchaeota archaeon]MBU1849558.1 hypothetical protein [Nanoarchaeota archaeon]